MPFKEPFLRTLRARWLGHQMRELRTQRGMTLQATAQYFGRDFSALARYEKAEWPFKRADVVALLEIYGVFDSKQRARLLQLCDDSWRTNEWDVDFADASYDNTFVDYAWLEPRAREISSYSTILLPGPFQTRPNAEAMVWLVEGAGAPAPKVTRWVDLQLERQRVLRSGRKKISAIIDGGLLHRVIGNADVMREQLDHLVALAREPHVDIRVLPEQVNLAARFNGPFWLFRMADPFPEVAYLENLAGRIYLESPHSKRFVVAYDRLREIALSPSESMKQIAEVAEAL